MYRLGIFIPVYYSEEDVAKCLMRLTELNYTGLKPSLFVCINGIRKSFESSFITDYIDTYSYSSNDPSAPIFEEVVTVTYDMTFDPSYLINGLIADHNELDCISVIEPKVNVHDLNIFQKYSELYELYDYRRNLGGLCTDNGTHNIVGDIIRWSVENDTIIRSLDGDGFGNGVLFTERSTWYKVDGFKGREYTNRFPKHFFRKGYLVAYTEGIR